MDKILFDMRFTAKQLLKESAKSEKKQKAEVRRRAGPPRGERTNNRANLSNRDRGGVCACTPYQGR